jgi:hypothetical protein
MAIRIETYQQDQITDYVYQEGSVHELSNTVRDLK